jgi:hypothetical protein
MKRKLPSKECSEARVREIARILLEGALPHLDIEEYIREKEQEPASPWFVDETKGQQPLGYSQCRRYIANAEKLIARDCEKDRDKLRGRHIAQRRAIFQKAFAAGDYRCALSAAIDEAKLEGAYPQAEDNRKGQPNVINVINRINAVTAELEASSSTLPRIVESRAAPCDLPGDGRGEPLDTGEVPTNGTAKAIPDGRGCSGGTPRGIGGPRQEHGPVNGSGSVS